MAGKVCVVTGANRGIGKATALGLARAGARVVMVCRDDRSAAKASAEIDATVGRAATEVVLADLASQQSTRQAAREILHHCRRIHVLINNAAVVAPTRIVTVDGHELQFAVNHLAVFLLTHLLRDRLEESAPARIVTVSSTAHTRGRMQWDDLQLARRYRPYAAYAQSKLANVLFTRELARRLSGTGVTANCLHPGVIATRLLGSIARVPRALQGFLRFFFDSPENGAKTSLFVATAASVETVTGQYFEKCQACDPSSAATDDASASRLWRISERLTGVATPTEPPGAQSSA